MYVRNLLCFLSLALLSACGENGSDDFTVNGTLANAPANTLVFLEEASFNNAHPTPLDSAKTDKNGKFVLSADATEENLYLLRTAGGQYPFAMVINDTKQLRLQADATKAGIFETSGSDATRALVDFSKTSNDRFGKISALTTQLDSMRRRGYPDSLVDIVKQQRAAETMSYKNYVTGILNQSNSPNLTIYVLGSYMSYSSLPALALERFPEADLKDIVARTAKKFPGHKGLAQLQRTFQAPQDQEVPGTQASALLNKPAPEFTLQDTDGRNVKLSSFKGKYVLVDFWASWCAPCRAENPNVVSAFRRYRNKNFTVLGVSLDNDRRAWKAAIAADSLSWIHVSDLKRWESPIVPLYQFGGIPYNVLVNPEGIIVAEGLRGEDLHRKLEELLGTQ